MAMYVTNNAYKDEQKIFLRKILQIGSMYGHAATYF